MVIDDAAERADDARKILEVLAECEDLRHCAAYLDGRPQSHATAGGAASQKPPTHERLRGLTNESEPNE